MHGSEDYSARSCRRQWDFSGHVTRTVGPSSCYTDAIRTTYVLQYGFLLCQCSHLYSGQSKNKASNAIQAILALDDSIKAEETAIKRLQASAGSALVDIVALHNTLQRARVYVQRLESNRLHHFKSLGLDQTAVLQNMKQNKYLIACMNALALKQRLRDWLRQRKFEMECLECNYRRIMNGTRSHLTYYSCANGLAISDMKSAQHIEGSVKRRAPTIQGIARKYNVLCVEIQQMVDRKVAPAGAVVPEVIAPGALWTLDVGDGIWQDVGLEETSGSTPPMWLKDEKVRAGI